MGKKEHKVRQEIKDNLVPGNMDWLKLKRFN